VSSVGAYLKGVPWADPNHITDSISASISWRPLS